jgi:hypothetical protein
VVDEGHYSSFCGDETVEVRLLNYFGDRIVAKGNALGIVIKIEWRYNPQ